LFGFGNRFDRRDQRGRGQRCIGDVHDDVAGAYNQTLARRNGYGVRKSLHTPPFTSVDQ
jgi:hypothetical protein